MEQPTIEKEPEKTTSPQKKGADFLKTARERLESIPVQPIWERVRKEVNVAMQALGRGTERAKKQTVLMGKQAKLQYDVYLQHHSLQKKLAELGGRTYDLFKKDAKGLGLSDKKAVEMIGQIGDLEKKIETLKAKAKALKKTQKPA